MKVVVDTNVFIDGLFKNDDFCRAIFRLKSLNKITFVMNKEMQNELLIAFGDILMEAIKRSDKSKKFNIFPLMAGLSKCLWQVEEIDHVIKTSYCIEDESDNKFIDCCIDGDVHYLITQDNHIGSVSEQLKKDYNIEVLSPFQFYTKYTTKQL